ncbi:MAG: 30S ribosomal protein S4e [Candidatus Woesearchaeota archaeon]|nr:30S ribosomal protein S4e [Candidatus Woesearchaeota archaeon]
MKKHLKRLAAPKSWPIKRKGTKFITRPLAGAHSLELGTPLTIILKDILGIAKNNKEVKHILNSKEILVDGKRRKEPRFLVGLMDVLSIPETKENFRVLLDKKGRLRLAKISEDEAKIKLSKIINKTIMCGGKMQLNLGDGRNVLVEKNDYKSNDVLVLNLPDQKIISALKFEKGASAYTTGGKHTAELAVIEEIKGDTIALNSKGKKFEAKKEHCFVVGKEKQLIKTE